MDGKREAIFPTNVPVRLCPRKGRVPLGEPTDTLQAKPESVSGSDTLKRYLKKRPPFAPRDTLTVKSKGAALPRKRNTPFPATTA
jgi:hypothetical protein